MKKISRLLAFGTVFLLMLIVGGRTVFAETDGQSVYKVECVNGDFTVDKGANSYETLSALITELGEDGAVFELADIEAHGTVSVNESITLRGKLRVIDGDVAISADSVLDGLELHLDGGSLRIREGRVDIRGGSISSGLSSAVVMDYSSGASLVADGAVISSSGVGGTVSLGLGTAKLIGCTVTNEYGAAVDSSGTLFIGGDCKLSGFGHDVRTAHPIHLTAENEEFVGTATVLCEKEFSKGSFTEVMLSATAESVGRITLLDKYGEEVETVFFEESSYSAEKSFLAVYMPYRVKFYSEDKLYYTAEYICGEKVFAPDPPIRDGYTFGGWYKDPAHSLRFDFGSEADSDISLFAAFSLLAPEFSISSLDVGYTKDTYRLAFESLSHPLAKTGTFSFAWFKNGELTDISTDYYPIRLVADTGLYSCRITFSVGSEVVSVSTPEVSVNVKPCVIGIPNAEPVVYNGKPQRPTGIDSELYTLSDETFTHAGEYTVTATLTDPENYRFEGTEGAEAKIRFTVLRAKNSFIGEPKVSDGYEGVAPIVSAEALFGTPRFMTSQDGKQYSEGFPEKVGSYYLVISIEGTDDYEALVSEPHQFKILKETVVAIRAEKLPTKTEYLAFEKVSLDGAIFLATYNSGRVGEISTDMLTAEYGKGESLRVGDKCVNIGFGGVFVPISVTVSPLEYDLSPITVSSLTAVYNGKRRCADVSGEVVGLDGIALSYTLVGGGIDAGVYTITLSFSTESREYKTPEPVIYTLTVEPMPIEVEFSDLEFVYDGMPKLPAATAVLATGLRIPLSVTGGATDAGEYIARATLADKNYKLVGDVCAFTIAKARLDLSEISWSSDSFVYNGETRSVSLSGLPSGVKLIGYTNASFRDVGKYRAVAALGYDEKNYEKPDMPYLDWEITPAEYDLSDFAFTDTEVVYDGKEHYPIFAGKLPVGFDGSSPSYTFSCGATNVRDGKVKVDIIFSCSSKNYKTPEPVSAYVTVKPKKITLVWSGLEVTYDGKYHSAEVFAEECLVAVTGQGLSAGEYTLLAECLDPNYSAVNPKAVLTIKKAENAWLKPPSILSYFTSGEPCPFGEALNGETVFEYYSDAKLENRIDPPVLAGDYYMVATVPESENYLALTSEKQRFSVIAVAPISLGVKLDGALTAMSCITASNITAYYINNDGTQTLIPFSDIRISYQNGDRLLFGDTGVTFSVGDMSFTAAVSVRKATYDMSGVHWENEYHIYDGEEKTAYLTGLPEGVSLIEYKFCAATAAGSYKLSAVLDYDTDNYYPPVIPDAWLVINKATVSLPELSSLVYNGMPQSPSVSDCDLYTVSKEEGVSVGEYSVTFILRDPANYEFEGEAVRQYKINPASITVEVGGDGKSYTVTEGVLASGDSLGEEYYREDGLIYLAADNKNYTVTVIPAEAKSRLPLILILIIAFLLLLLGTYIIIANRRNIAVFVSGAAAKRREHRARAVTEKASCVKLETLLAVDAAHANEMITDAMARSLLGDMTGSIETVGRAKVSVNIDKLSEAFAAGEIIDINSMKDRGLIPRDAFSVKVLAGGVIDKPLTVIANAFSPSAVKMIALTGGTAKRARTSRPRNKTRDKKSL